jgi:hypothetical protein
MQEKNSMSKNAETTQVQNPCMLAASDYPVLMWRQQAGLYRSYDDPNRLVRVGLNGMADTGMIVPMKITPEMVGRTVGVAVQVEFKTATGRQSEKQKNWEQAVLLAGGRYEVIRNVDEFRSLIESMI